MLIELLPLGSADRDAVIDLFANYPLKARQKDVQGIAPDRLARLLWESVEARMDDPGTSAWVAYGQQPRRAVGFGMLTAHPWHTEIFGRSMGRIEHWVNYLAPDTVGPPLIEALLDGARKAEIEHLACRVDAQDWNNVHGLESYGFRCVDCSLKMVRPLEDLRETPSAERSVDLRIRPFDAADLEALQQIATRSHVYNHFYNDPALGRDCAEALFREWIARCANRLAEFVLVAEDPDGQLLGFITVLANAALARIVGVRAGIIDYIVVDRSAARRGIGRALLEAALRRIAPDYDWAELRTSHDNYAAVAFYNAAGFRTVASDFVLHRCETTAAPAWPERHERTSPNVRR